MEPRLYRHWIDGTDLVPFTVTVKETDLYIRAAADLRRKARRIVLKYRSQLEEHIKKNPTFQASLEPVPMPAHPSRMVRAMIEASTEAGVGPMAAVAGAIAEYVGNELLTFSPEIIIENGGDIYMKNRKKRVIGIYAGESPLTGTLGLEIEAGDTPLGICTSSGTIGHSLSYGRADAVIALSPSTALADAAATAIGNRVKYAGDIDDAIAFGRGIEGITGVVIIAGDRMGAWGNVKLCETSA